MKKGFTLLELSIVLVIIGLIIGGVTVGADLIKAAELNSLISDQEKFKVAAQTFRLKYNALPGDMKNASSYWPTECVDDGDNKCNGNGNQKIDNTKVVGFEGFAFYEPLRFWQHLALSGIISGSYTGLGTETSDSGHDSIKSIVGENIPVVRFNSAGLKADQHDGVNSFILTKNFISTVSGSQHSISAASAYIIDNKIDDGNALSGRVRTFGTTKCLSSTTESRYKINLEEIGCQMAFQF